MSARRKKQSPQRKGSPNEAGPTSPPAEGGQSGGGGAGPRDRLLTLPEVEERTRHKKSWIYEQIRAGRFPPGHKLGRRRVWWETEVERAIRGWLRPA